MPWSPSKFVNSFKILIQNILIMAPLKKEKKRFDLGPPNPNVASATIVYCILNVNYFWAPRVYYDIGVKYFMSFSIVNLC